MLSNLRNMKVTDLRPSELRQQTPKAHAGLLGPRQAFLNVRIDAIDEFLGRSQAFEVAEDAEWRAVPCGGFLLHLTNNGRLADPPLRGQYYTLRCQDAPEIGDQQVSPDYVAGTDSAAWVGFHTLILLYNENIVRQEYCSKLLERQLGLTRDPFS